MSLVLKIEVADWNASPKRGSSGVAATKRRETRSAAHTAHSSVSICWGFALELSNCAHVVLPQVSWPFNQLPGVVVGCPWKNACVSDSLHDEAFGYLKRVIVTPAVFPLLVNFITLTFRALGRNPITPTPVLRRLYSKLSWGRRHGR